MRESIHFEVLRRKGIDETAQREDGVWYTFHNVNSLGDVSSTQARVSTEMDELTKFVTPSVASYIRENYLYAFSSNA